MAKDGEIVGLKESSNGRSCACHDCCGEHIARDDLVRFKLTVIDIDEKVEKGIKVVWIRDGTELCTIGFLPQNIVRKSGTGKFVGQFAQIIELYDYSENGSMRRKSQRNKGMASYRMLKDIEEQE